MADLRRLQSDARWVIFLAELGLLGVVVGAIAGKTLLGVAFESWREGGFKWR